MVVLVHSATLHWRHNDHDGVSNRQPHGCLLNSLFRRRSMKTSKLRVTGLCVGNSPGPVNSPHKGPVTRKMLPFDDVIMSWQQHIPTDKTATKTLTHRGRVTHICVSNLTTMGSDKGLLPGQHQAIIRTNAGMLFIRPLETNFSGILVEILIFSFKNTRLKVSSAKWRFFFSYSMC